MSRMMRKHYGFLAKHIYSSPNNLTAARQANWKNFQPVDSQFHTSTNLAKIVSFNLSDIGEGIREVAVKEWFVKEGDVVEQFDNLCEVQSDKASVTITSRYDGKIVKIHHAVDAIALVGKPLVDFDVKDEDSDSSSTDSDGPTSSTITQTNSKTEEANLRSVSTGKVLATPATRRLAMENKLDLNKVKASGKFGRVLKGDILEHLNLIPQGTVKPHPTQALQKTSSAAKTVSLLDRVEPLKGVAKVMFKSMTEALKIPHFAYSDEIDMTKLVALRTEIKKEAENEGIKLTYMPFFVKAASLALLEYPILNSSVCEKTESLIYKGSHNISIAIHTPQGLVVPNIKDVQNKSLLDIALEVNTLQEKGQKGSLTPDDFANGTFSLSNIGVIGGTYTHPCIMAPQVAIGAVGKTKIVPRFDANGEIMKAHVMHVSWSADHRVIDGVTMASFSNVWKKYLENPNIFILKGR